MEPHPIPQNVTTFEFHLIGDMTLKQFMYLAAGSTIAYVLFVFVSSAYPLIAWPLIVISASLGFAFAFLPINSRPLDYWLGAFLKAVYSPTKRVWQKNNKTAVNDPLFGSRFVTYVSGLYPPAPAEATTVPSQAVIPPEPIPTADDLKKTVDLAKEAQNLQWKIIQTERTLSHIREEAQKPKPIPVDYSGQVNQVLADLQNLVNQASQIKQQLETVGEEELKSQTIPVPMAKPEVKVITPQKSKATQIALTSFPNVINGIIKDARGNSLEGVVVVIYDKEGLPVRALKTNKLGQFSGATPLPNGTYKIELEKDTFGFDVLQIELTGQVISPLTITAKEAVG
ncbi:PrgI family protein [Candidatus Daviesbacteria bacterium]|nr:PrgI family protein [Candidatus Daviesbacteria bacterium]